MTKLIKALLLNAAAIAAAPILGNTRGPDGKLLPIDPDIADSGIRSENLESAQEIKIFYTFLRTALESTNAQDGWADPALPAGTGIPDVTTVVQKLAGLLPGSAGTVAQAIAPLLAQAAQSWVPSLVPPK